MALKSIIYKADLHISDMDRHYYQEQHLTLAKHPSETDERLMVRLLAFTLYAGEGLVFGKGISAEDEPVLCRKNLDGTFELWLEVGLPDERRIRKACGRAKHVVIVAYGKSGTVDMWWRQNRGKLNSKKNLTVIQVPLEATQAMTALASRNMQLSCTIEAGQVFLTNETSSVTIEPNYLKQDV